MAAIYVCLFFVSLQIITVWNHTVITGLYCQDPDTGNLHAVNTTWRSKSFCGNYTCKLKKKNFTETEFNPIKINVSLDDSISVHTETYTVDENSDKNSNKTGKKEHIIPNSHINKSNVIRKQNIKESKTLNKHMIDMLTSPSTHIPNQFAPEEIPDDNDRNNVNIIANDLDIENKQNDTNTTSHHTDIGSESTTSNDDRYLSESEIKEIAETLRTVKKSDLEAIIEIYNIAQDIFREVEEIGTTTDKMFKKSTSPLDNLLYSGETHIHCNKDNKSYWYDPYHHHKDAKLASSVATPIYYYPKTYLRGLLGTNELQKVPYYYPISDFQRMASYLKPTEKTVNIDKLEIQPRFMTYNQAPTFIAKPWPSGIKVGAIDLQKKTPTLLPYPFSYIRHYNISSHPNDFNYNNYPWEKLDVYNKNRNHVPNFLSLFNTENSNGVTVSNTKLDKPKNQQVNVKEPVTINNDFDINKKKNLPEWQLPPDHPLEEAKNYVMDKTKLVNKFPRKSVKNVKVEKLGKVIKLDELVREKRFDTNFENLEMDTVLEKITCESSTEIGFFRHGNESQPYPACCPQKIGS